MVLLYYGGLENSTFSAPVGCISIVLDCVLQRPRIQGVELIVKVRVSRIQVYDNNNYYLLADEGVKSPVGEEDNLLDNEDVLKTFRVDRMTNVEITKKADNELFLAGAIDTASYVNSTFDMYHGKEAEVRMLFNKEMMDFVIDKFGKDVETEIVDDEHFRVKAKVMVSPQFYGWVFSLGQNAMIEYPLWVAKEMKNMLKERHKAYRESHSGAIYMV